MLELPSWKVWGFQLTKAIRRYKFGFVFGVALCITSCMMIAFTIWKAWSEISSNTDPLSAFWHFLWVGEIDLIPGVEFKLTYLVILAGALLCLGVGVIAFSRQWFFLPGTTMKLQCPFCKKLWKAGFNRGQILCPHCRHLIHPRIVEE